MKLGMIGLGRMGANMVERLLGGRHTVVGHARRPESVRRIVEKGAEGAESLAVLVSKLEAPRIVWVMVPAGDPTEQVIVDLAHHLAPGDLVIDGGNSNFKETVRRAAMLEGHGIGMLDVGTSGGVHGLREGYSMMIGGAAKDVERLAPVFETLAPAPDRGWGHVGVNGAGHYVKMVHNGIEYGLMQSYAEGFSLLHAREDFGLDLRRIAEIWRFGSVVRSWLLDLIAEALGEDSDLGAIAPYVEDSGEGRWTVHEMLEMDVPAPVITLSLIQRIRSREKHSYGDRLLAAMRNKFGGHPIKRGK